MVDVTIVVMSGSNEVIGVNGETSTGVNEVDIQTGRWSGGKLEFGNTVEGVVESGGNRERDDCQADVNRTYFL